MNSLVYFVTVRWNLDHCATDKLNIVRLKTNWTFIVAAERKLRPVFLPNSAVTNQRNIILLVFSVKQNKRCSIVHL